MYENFQERTTIVKKIKDEYIQCEDCDQWFHKVCENVKSQHL